MSVQSASSDESRADSPQTGCYSAPRLNTDLGLDSNQTITLQATYKDDGVTYYSVRWTRLDDKRLTIAVRRLVPRFLPLGTCLDRCMCRFGQDN